MQTAHRTFSEVVDILDMWYFIESGYAALSDADKTRVEKEAEPFGKDVKFPGFDGNNEIEHLSIAKFLVNKLGRFQSLNIVNSHSRSIEMYKRMLPVFNLMRGNLGQNNLSVKQIIELLEARMHPEHR